MYKRFDVIGITDSPTPQLSQEAREVIANGKIFSGGKRHHEIMRRFLPENHVWIDVAVPLKDTFSQYDEHDDIVVFASGDPLFFGYATTLQRHFPDAKTKVYPTFNSLQMLAHRLNQNYEDMVCVSLTGRPWNRFWEEIIKGKGLVGVLTDRKNTPAAIASQLLRYGYSNYEISVGAHLGNPGNEKVCTLPLEEAALMDFDFPNCVILKAKDRLRRNINFGIPEKEFEHLPGRDRMITKMPIRLLSLSMLDLANRNSMWDIGFCTGSVSIEAKLLFPHLRITAFEKREECEEIFSNNARKFGAPGIDSVIGDFFSLDLSQYPAPDAVFIGGHGGRLPEMLKLISHYAKEDCVTVFNSVSEESKDAFIKGVTAIGKTIVESHKVSLDDFNPIIILKAQ